jgi:hypothetical protein
MTETSVPDAAVRIAFEAVTRLVSLSPVADIPHSAARAAIVALARAGWLHDPVEVERLRGELAAAESTIRILEDPELRKELTTPTEGDYGPVPYPAAPDDAPAATSDR